MILYGNLLRTLLAGVRVPSTSNKHIVFLVGLWFKGGMIAAASAMMKDDITPIAVQLVSGWVEVSCSKQIHRQKPLRLLTGGHFGSCGHERLPKPHRHRGSGRNLSQHQSIDHLVSKYALLAYASMRRHILGSYEDRSISTPISSPRSSFVAKTMHHLSQFLPFILHRTY